MCVITIFRVYRLYINVYTHTNTDTQTCILSFKYIYCLALKNVHTDSRSNSQDGVLRWSVQLHRMNFQVNFRKSHHIFDQFDASIKSYIKMFAAAGLLDPSNPGRVKYKCT